MAERLILVVRTPMLGNGFMTTFENLMKLYVGNLSFSTSENALRDR
jgi:hypothetical protein